MSAPKGPPKPPGAAPIRSAAVSRPAPAVASRPAPAPSSRPAPSSQTAPSSRPAPSSQTASVVPPPPSLLRAPLDPQQVYWVTSNLDPTALVARRAGVDEGWLHWDDTNRDRQRRAETVDVREGGVVTILTEGGAEYTFTPLTLEIYREHVQREVELSPDFDSTDALLHFYRTASFG